MPHKPLRTYLRLRRRESGLSQDDLADLVGTHGSVISDYELERHPISARLLIAVELIFGLAGRDMFPALYRQIEEEVCIATAALYEQLEGKTDARSAKRRKLLASIPDRVTPIDV
jgi:transcriptional regulator with XRE-family HTH domain